MIRFGAKYSAKTEQEAKLCLVSSDVLSFLDFGRLFVAVLQLQGYIGLNLSPHIYIFVSYVLKAISTVL